MSFTDCCQPCNTQVPPVNIPGSPGAAGAAGAPGADGIDSFSLLTANMIVPGDTVTPVTITVNSSLWMVIGQSLKIGQGAGVVLANPGPASFIITAIPSPLSVTLLWENATGDVAAGSQIDLGAVVSPSGTQPSLANDAVTPTILNEPARMDTNQYAVGTFAASVYAITLAPAATVYTAGMHVTFNPDSDNTGPVDANVNTLGAANIFKLDGQELAAKDIRAGQIVEIVYDGADFRLLGPIQPRLLTATGSLDFPNTLTQESSDLTIAVVGAADGDPVWLGIPLALANANACFTAFVSLADTVTVRFNNYSAGAINLGPGTFRVVVAKF